MPIDYLQKILTAKVYDVAVETPLEEAATLSRRLGNRVLLKREDQQSVFSFKLRGAYNKMAHLTPAERASGVIAASAGNHAQGVALAAQRLGCAATIVMPITTPHIKIAAVEARGATVVLHGDSYSDAFDEAQRLQKASGATFVHPYDDPDVIAGQGTIGMEILRQCQGPLDAIFVAIGGGGLISGIAAYVKRVRPEVKVIGVQPVDSDAMTRSRRRRQARGAVARGPVRRRRRGEAGRPRDVPPGAAVRRRDDDGRHRRDVRGDQGRVRGHALASSSPRARWRSRASRRGARSTAHRDARTSRSPAAPT